MTRRWRGVGSNFWFRNSHRAPQDRPFWAGSAHDSARAERIPTYPALSPTPPADSNSVTSCATEVDPVLRAPLPQSRFLGLVRKIVPQVEGAPTHQQILISAVSASSAEDVANFVVVVG